MLQVDPTPSQPERTDVSWRERWRAHWSRPRLTAQEAANMRATQPRFAIYTASLGGHPPHG